MGSSRNVAGMLARPVHGALVKVTDRTIGRAIRRKKAVVSIPVAAISLGILFGKLGVGMGSAFDKFLAALVGAVLLSTAPKGMQKVVR